MLGGGTAMACMVDTEFSGMFAAMTVKKPEKENF